MKLIGSVVINVVSAVWAWNEHRLVKVMGRQKGWEIKRILNGCRVSTTPRHFHKYLIIFKKKKYTLLKIG